MPDGITVSQFKLALTGLYAAGDKWQAPASPGQLREYLDSDISDSTIKAVTVFHLAEDPEKLARAVQKLDLPRERIGRAMSVANCNIKVLSHAGGTPGSFSWEYVPDIIEWAHPDGEIYMCKEVDAEKAMAVWEENSDNVVVTVDNYEPGEVLGWPRLGEPDSSGSSDSGRAGAPSAQKAVAQKATDSINIEGAIKRNEMKQLRELNKSQRRRN